MEKFQIFIQLTRLNKPIGFLLLFWPCVWGLTLAYYFSGETNLYLKHILLFFLGSVLMRSAGCILNDIVDRDLDKKVQRTRERPIASGKISVSKAFTYMILLCLVALLILLQFNWLTIVLGLGSMILAFAYPFMKRITYWPQLFLGLTFNWGILLGWTAFKGEISLEPILLYIAAIFWTLGYDTIYGFQDIYDDEIIGVKSTSIKFKENYKLFIGLCYFICVLFLIILGFLEENKMYYFTFLIFPVMHLLHQMTRLDKNNSNSCLIIFKSNNFFGFLVFLTLMTINI